MPGTPEVDERGDYDRPYLGPGDHTVTLPEGLEASDPDTLEFTIGEDEHLHHDIAVAPGPPAVPRSLDTAPAAGRASGCRGRRPSTTAAPR